MRRQLFSLCSLLALGASTLFGQSNFQDLNFESVTAVPVPDPYGRVSLSAAMPGWLGFSGITPLDRVNYNSQFLDSTGISILNENTFWGGPIQGYTVLLQAGADLCCADLNTRADVGLAQTGTIPADSHSIQFAARMGFNDLNSRFTASFGGQPLALVQTSTMADYGMYGTDVSAFAGQTGELRFMVSAGTSGTGMRNIFLDSIQFSPLPVPEPGVLAVLAPGAAVFLLWRGRRPRE